MTRSRIRPNRTARAMAGAALACMASLAAGLEGCRAASDDGPPTLRLGRDQCSECGMIINEDRCSCASRISTPKGTDVALFDDIGCLLEHERQNPETQVLHRFVHDHATKEWVNADQAAFLWAEAIRTPMGSGIVAFSTRDGATVAAKEHPGEIYDFSGLVAARTKWMQDQFGSPQTQDK